MEPYHMPKQSAAIPTVTTPGPVLIDMDAIRARYGLTFSRSQFYKLVRDGRLPAPIKSGRAKSCKIFWRRDAIEAAIARWESENGAAA
jgi:predicted DNA-binding transcriptional regulator AlpA